MSDDVVAEGLADAFAVHGSRGVGEGEEDADDNTTACRMGFARSKDAVPNQEGAIGMLREFVDFDAIGIGRVGIPETIIESVVDLRRVIGLPSAWRVAEGRLKDSIGDGTHLPTIKRGNIDVIWEKWLRWSG